MTREAETSRPEQAAACGFATYGWACNGEGMLVLAGNAGSLGTPCPRCATAAYLARAWQAAHDSDSAPSACTCCPGRSGSALWDAAVAAAKAANPGAAYAALRALSPPRRFRAEAVTNFQRR